MICDVTMETQQCQTIPTQFWARLNGANFNLNHFKMVEAMELKIMVSSSPSMV
jgi:hypothetical protein